MGGLTLAGSRGHRSGFLPYIGAYYGGTDLFFMLINDKNRARQTSWGPVCPVWAAVSAVVRPKTTLVPRHPSLLEWAGGLTLAGSRGHQSGFLPYFGAFFFVGSKNGPESINIDKVLICEVQGSASNVATG